VELLLERLDAFALGLALALLGLAAAIRQIRGLLTVDALALQLLGLEPPAAAVLGALLGVHGGSLNHRRELVPGRPVLRVRVVASGKHRPCSRAS